jgi:hypothetical protein
MTKKVKKRYGTISKLFQAAKEFYQKKRTEKNEEKTKPYLKLIHLLRQCIEERDGMLYVFANRLSRRLHRFSYFN